MNNKPVAWMCKSGFEYQQVKEDFSYKEKEGWIPLYTHPVKELTEPSVKEITDLWLDVINNIPANDHRPREWHFAKAILRKAQEK